MDSIQKRRVDKSNTPRRWAIRDAGEATFYDLTDGHVITTLRTLKTSGVETSGDTVYSRGGFGNPKLVGFSSNREAKLTLEDAIFDNLALAMLTGNDPEIKARVIYKNEVKTVVSNKITLTNTPVGAIIGVYKVNPDGTNGEEYTLGTPSINENEYSILDKSLTFHSSVENSANIRVYYKVKTGADTTRIKVTSDKFGGTFKVVLDVIVRDEYTKDDYAGQIYIPNAKFEDNFNIDLSVDGDPASLTLTMELLKDPVSNDMWALDIFDNSTIV